MNATIQFFDINNKVLKTTKHEVSRLLEIHEGEQEIWLKHQPKCHKVVITYDDLDRRNKF